MSKKLKSFTVIELLVVISIIGILAGIMWVSLSGARLKAKIAKAQGEVSTIYKAIMMLHADTGRYPAVKNINSTADFKTYCYPYLSNITDDPWENSYYYHGCPEPCGDCEPDTCEVGVGNTWVCSAGPDQVLENPPAGDDICIYFK